MIRRATFRVAVIAVIAVVTGCLLVGFLVHQNRQMHRRLRLERQHAVAAAQQGRYAAAIDPLQAYLARTRTPDVEALYHLALAVRATPSPGDTHLVRAARLMRRVVEREPDHLEAHRALLGLYEQLGFDREVVVAADHIRRLAPADLRPLQAKAMALLRLERYEDALAAAERWIADAPQDLEAHLLALAVLRRGPWPARQVLTRAAALQQAQPKDVRFLILEGAAHRMVGRVPEAAALLRRAAAEPMPDAATTRILVRELEAVDLFTEARAALEQAVARFGSIDLRRQLAHRLWQGGQIEALRQHLAPLQAADEDADLDLLAIRAMVLIRDGDRLAAERIIDTIRRREDDRAAAAWSIYLGGVFARELDAETAIRRCRLALARDAANPYIQSTLAENLVERGNVPGAMEAWSTAARACPAWAAPRMRIARLLVDLDLAHQAIAFAEAARLREPESLEVRVALALAMDLHRRQGGEHSRASVFEWVEAIQKKHPGELDTLPLYVSLLAETGRHEDAGEVLLAALDQALPERTLLRLADVSREHGLGLTRTCYVQSEALHGRTPALAHARAVHLWRLGRIDEGLAELLPPAGVSMATWSRDWRVARARFLDEVGRPEARDAWRRLAEAYPDDTALQRQVLHARSVQVDRVLMLSTIERLKQLTGGDGLLWRIAEARTRLASPGSPPADTATAALLLGEVVRRVPEMVEPRLLLANCFERMDSGDMALEQLRLAYQAEPHLQGVALELARALLDRDEKVQALALIEGVVDNDATTVEELQQAAVMLVRLRDWNQAAAALTRALEAGGSAAEGLVFIEGSDAAAEDASDRAAPRPLPDELVPFTP